MLSQRKVLLSNMSETKLLGHNQKKNVLGVMVRFRIIKIALTAIQSGSIMLWGCYAASGN